MEIGIGLPNAIHDIDADSLLEFAKRADARGFSSLGTVDRIVYPNLILLPSSKHPEQVDLLAVLVGK